MFSLQKSKHIGIAPDEGKLLILKFPISRRLERLQDRGIFQSEKRRFDGVAEPRIQPAGRHPGEIREGRRLLEDLQMNLAKSFSGFTCASESRCLHGIRSKPSTNVRAEQDLTEASEKA